MAQKITVDFSDVPASFLPAGDYEAVINEGILKTSQNSGGQYINWEFELTEGEAAGRKAYMMTSLLPQALFGLRDMFATVGLDAAAISELEVDEDSGMILDPDFSGMPVKVKLNVEEYNGIKRNKVVKIVECHRPFGQDAEPVYEEGVVPADDEQDPEEAADDLDRAYQAADAMQTSFLTDTGVKASADDFTVAIDENGNDILVDSEGNPVNEDGETPI